MSLHDQDTFKIKWSTQLAISLSLGGDIKDVVARGTCLAAISDEPRYQANTGTADDLTSRIQNIIQQTVADQLGAVSNRYQDFDELKDHAEDLSENLAERLRPDFEYMGLIINDFTIEEFEKI